MYLLKICGESRFVNIKRERRIKWRAIDNERSCVKWLGTIESSICLRELQSSVLAYNEGSESAKVLMIFMDVMLQSGLDICSKCSITRSLHLKIEGSKTSLIKCDRLSRPAFTKGMMDPNRSRRDSNARKSTKQTKP